MEATHNTKVTSVQDARNGSQMANGNEHIANIPTSDIFKEFPDCVNVMQLQQMLSIGRNRAYELLKTGQIKHKRIGKIYYIPKAYVVEFLLKNQ